jgi:GGDEF domain-containing protein
VLWIDLDHFKEVNHIFGHDVGDEMLVAVADRLREVVRETDDIARTVGERVLHSLSDRDAFRLQVGVSVGVGWQRNAVGGGRSLIRRADQAMYRAKAAGGGQSVM